MSERSQPVSASAARIGAFLRRVDGGAGAGRGVVDERADIVLQAAEDVDLGGHGQVLTSAWSRRIMGQAQR